MIEEQLHPVAVGRGVLNIHDPARLGGHKELCERVGAHEQFVAEDLQEESVHARRREAGPAKLWDGLGKHRIQRVLPLHLQHQHRLDQSTKHLFVEEIF